ncbi:hypothetical protein Tco_1087329 [Tanacetum coccineum]
MPTHNIIYIAPSHTKKIFRNMRRVGKGFPGGEIPLFQTMKQKPRKPKRKDTQIPQSSGPTKHVADEAVYKELDDSLVRAATTASSLEAEQDNGNINKTHSKATPNESSSLRTTLGGGPRCQETIGDTIAQTRFENVSKVFNDPLLARVLNLEKTKTTQAEEIGSINAIVADEDITLVNDQDDADMFDVNTLTGDEVLAEQEVATKDVNLSVDEVTLAQALATLKSAKVQEKGDVIKEPSVPVSVVSASTKDSAAITITATIPTPRKGIIFQELEEQPSHANVQDKGKGKMVEPEKPMKKKKLIRLDEEIASKLQAEFDEEAKIEADHELAQRLQAQEQEERGTNHQPKLNKEKLPEEYGRKEAQRQAEEQEKLSIKEKSKFFVQLLEARKKHFAAIRAKEMRNKPPTKDQKRNTMSAYLKNMARYKHNQLKNKSFDIQKLFEKAMKRVNTFVDMDTDLVEGSEVRAEGSEIRADGSSKMYLVFSHMLKSFDREDLETLYKLVKAKYGSIRPVEDLDLVLYGDLKTMFEPHVEDNVWKNQSYYRVLDWKLYDSCGVHSLRKENVHIHMLVEKRYPLTHATITDMLNRKLQADHWNEMIKRLHDDLEVTAAKLKLGNKEVDRGKMLLREVGGGSKGAMEARERKEGALASIQRQRMHSCTQQVEPKLALIQVELSTKAFHLGSCPPSLLIIWVLLIIPYSQYNADAFVPRVEKNGDQAVRKEIGTAYGKDTMTH